MRSIYKISSHASSMLVVLWKEQWWGVGHYWTVFVSAPHFDLCIFLSEKILRSVPSMLIEQTDFIIFTFHHLANLSWMFPKTKKQISISTPKHFFLFQCNKENHCVFSYGTTILLKTVTALITAQLLRLMAWSHFLQHVLKQENAVLFA